AWGGERIGPSLAATANNAILESMACGVPLVVTDVGGVRDYVGADAAALVRRGDARHMVETALALLGDNCERKRMADLARARALQFAWTAVVPPTEFILVAGRC